MKRSVGSASEDFAALVEPADKHADSCADTLSDRHRDKTQTERDGENPERQPDDAARYSAQAEKPVRSPHPMPTLSMQHDHSDASTSPGCDLHDPIAYMVIPAKAPATLSRAGAEAMVVLDGEEDAADVLAWCSANNCRAQPVFIGKLYRRGTRCFAIVAGDDDAAFAFRMRWV